MFLVVRHNMPYANKVFDVLVELMGIATGEDEAMDKILDEVNDFLCYVESDYLKTRTDFTRNNDGTLSLVFDFNELAYDIIPVEVGFPDKYITLAGA